MTPKANPPLKPLYIDNLQYAHYSPPLFDEMAEACLSAVHVTICYHENFRATVENMITWNRHIEAHPNRLIAGRTGDDVRLAHRTGRTAIFYGFQNCAPIEDDIGLIEILHQLGGRFMQLSYNNQSLLATGCYEREDPGPHPFWQAGYYGDESRWFSYRYEPFL